MIIAVFVLFGTSAAYATITAPTQNPFTVPGDSAGNPQPFTISANGFTGVSFVFVEQCDGTPSTAQGWNPNINCDSGTSPAKKAPDGSGAVTFPADAGEVGACIGGRPQAAMAAASNVYASNR